MPARLSFSVFTLTTVVAATLASGCSELSAGANDHADSLRSSPRPNIVFIYTDDQDLSHFRPRVMPRTFKRIVRPGTRFSDYVVASPLCCPSRVSFLTGQYPHNHGTFDNGDGYPALRHKKSTLASWLDGAGYRTAWVGKFIQGYDQAHAIATPAPGLDQWAVTVEPRYYDYDLGLDGTVEHKGSGPRDYHTYVMTRMARHFVAESARKGPFFMVVNYLAPHSGKGGSGTCAGTAQPARRDLGRFSQAKLPDEPSFNEADVRDKPHSLRKPPLGPRARHEIARRYRCRLASLAALDRGVGAIFRQVKRTHQLDQTIFVISSDNGLLLGQHRRQGKHWAYEEGIHMPLAMRVPGRYLSRPAQHVVRELVSNIDLAPTLLDLAGGVRPCAHGLCRELDGRSFAPLLAGGDRWPRDRSILIESGHGNCKLVRAIRTPGDIYIAKNHGSGSCGKKREPEYYDLRSDPFQLKNLAQTKHKAKRQAQLRRRFHTLERCQGPGCR